MLRIIRDISFGDLVSISPTFYEQLLHSQIPKAEKIQLSHQHLFMLLGSVRVKAVHRTLMKLSPEIVMPCRRSNLHLKASQFFSFLVFHMKKENLTTCHAETTTFICSTTPSRQLKSLYQICFILVLPYLDLFIGNWKLVLRVLQTMPWNQNKSCIQLS